MARKCEIMESFRIMSKKLKYLSIKVMQYQFDLMDTCCIGGTGCNLKPEEINSGFLHVHHSCDRRVFLSARAAQHVSGTTCRFFFPNKHQVIYCQTADHTKWGQSIDEEKEESARLQFVLLLSGTSFCGNTPLQLQQLRAARTCLPFYIAFLPLPAGADWQFSPPALHIMMWLMCAD